MAAITQAKSSDDVANTIEAFALPSGSARVKRESKFNVALNAFVGPYIGYEQISGLDKNWLASRNSNINSYGLTVPIGLSINWGRQKFFFQGKGHWSYSLFISVIDIGAVTAFRFQNDSTAQVPTIQLKNIISPGALFSIGIPKSPLSINIGVQSGPNLRTVSSRVNSYSNNTYLRFSASLVVDIPLLNFHTASKE